MSAGKSVSDLRFLSLESIGQMKGVIYMKEEKRHTHAFSSLKVGVNVNLDGILRGLRGDLT